MKDSFKKYLVTCSTNWCGMDREFRAIASSDLNDILIDSAELAAYENAYSFDLINDYILPELFPEVEDGEYTEEQIQYAEDHDYEYFGFSIDEWGGPEEEWSWYEWLYDETEEYKE